MNVKKKAALLLAGLALLGSCKTNTKTSAPQAEPIDTKIVLSVGKVNITAYEFEKNLKTFKQTFLQKNGHEPQAADIQSWENDFINRAYFLADAYDKGYDKDRHIDSMVESVGHFIIAQNNGLLEKKMEGNGIQPNSPEVRVALERSKKKMVIEYIRFKDEQTALKALHNKLPANGPEFKQALAKTDLVYNPYGQDTLVWPFEKFWGREEYLFNLKNDEVTPLVKFADGCCIFHVTNIDYALVPPINESMMLYKLQILQKQKIRQLNNTETIEKAHIQIDNNTADKLAPMLKNYIYGAGHTFVKSGFNKLLPQKLLTYNRPDGHPEVITIGAFLDYYNSLLLKQDINNTDDLNTYLTSMVSSDYAFAKAVKMGITRQPKFMLDQQNYKNKLVYAKYEAGQLDSKDPVSDNEILAVYNMLKPHFIEATDAVVSVYYFHNRLDALQAMARLRRNIIEASGFSGLDAVKLHLNLNYTSSILPDTLKKIAFSLKNNMISNPVNVQGNFAIVKKESESGSRVKNLTEVRDVVIKAVGNERLAKNKQMKISQLKEQYKLKNNIDTGLFK